MTASFFPEDWLTPSPEFSLAPFWFWNDDLTETELTRQLDAFQVHGVDAFVIHPRVGLPRSMGWMSRPLLDRMRFVIEQAQARDMWVILYDEGMYPSGSSSGQVVAENPAYTCRGLVRINLDTVQRDSIEQGIRIGPDGRPALAENQTLIAEVDYNGQRYAIIERPIDAVIRGLHFIDENSIDAATGEPPEDTPPAIDLLNPDAVACFIRLVYDRYDQEFGAYFGSTIRAIFTDEPNLLGRCRETGILPGTTDILPHVNAFLGYDFTPHLPALWESDAPQTIKQDYERAVEHRFEETYYTQLYDWCTAHHIALTGHPAEPDATRHLRYFHIPGQDIVWRYIEPDKPSALSGRQSTQGKGASSAMLHLGRRRNANEFCGAYGHDLTFDEMRWLANWLLIRGCNLLIPHAFYYSVRGPRKDERPPDVGLHSAWWDDGFTDFAQSCRRLCWLNIDSHLVCHVAILGEHHHLPWRAAGVCFENQIDFNYLDADDLLNAASIKDRCIQIAGQTYRVLIVDGDISPTVQATVDALADNMPVLYWNTDSTACLDALRQHVPASLSIHPDTPGLRLRQVQKAGFDWFMLFNETAAAINITIDEQPLDVSYVVNPDTGAGEPFDGHLHLDGHELRVIAAKMDECV